MTRIRVDKRPEFLLFDQKTILPEKRYCDRSIKFERKQVNTDARMQYSRFVLCFVEPWKDIPALAKSRSRLQ